MSEIKQSAIKQSEIKWFTDKELLYAATARCRCGAGLAYPHDTETALQFRSWICSAVLKGQTDGEKAYAPPFLSIVVTEGKHDQLPFAFYKVREESSVNNTGGWTTRPPGTICRTVGTAHCPRCDHRWESEPYDAATMHRHWNSGPCPRCTNDNYCGNNRPYEKENRIDQRFRDIVLEVTPDVEPTA
jgi:hypothetical protein